MYLHMDYIHSFEQVVKTVVDRGNSGGVYLPKQWVGQQVIIRPLSVREYVLNLLTPHMEDIVGLYLVGSYARGEQEADSDIDILIISADTLEFTAPAGIDVRMIPKSQVINAVRNSPFTFAPLLAEAIPIVNKSLLGELRAIQVSAKKYSWLTDTTDTALKMNAARIELGEHISRASLSRFENLFKSRVAKSS